MFHQLRLMPSGMIVKPDIVNLVDSIARQASMIVATFKQPDGIAANLTMGTAERMAGRDGENATGMIEDFSNFD
ncbi:MAG: hypothetical protein Q9219_007663 [cf. Caloplaca sp. 3 TL-2023]